MFGGAGDSIRDAIINMLTDALDSFDSMISEVLSVLALDMSSGSGGLIEWSAANTTVNKVSDILRGFCLPIAGICLLIELAQVASKVDVIKWEHGLKVAVKMALTVVFINHVPILLQALYYKASEWIASVEALGNSNAGVGASVSADLADVVNAVTGTFGPIGLFPAALIIWLIIKGCAILVTVIAYVRLFEILVYIAISPLPCAFFPLGNGDGSGFSRITAKFLRSFAGVCLHGVMIIICLLIFNSFIGDGMTNKIVEQISAAGTLSNLSIGDAFKLIYELCFMVVVAALLLLMTVTKCGGWAKAVIDG